MTVLRKPVELVAERQVIVDTVCYVAPFGLFIDLPPRFGGVPMMENDSTITARCEKLELGTHREKPCLVVSCYVDPIKEELAGPRPLSIQDIETMLRDKEPAKPKNYPVAPVRVTSLASGRSFVADDLRASHYRGRSGSFSTIRVFVYDVTMDLSEYLDQDVRIDSI